MRSTPSGRVRAKLAEVKDQVKDAATGPSPIRAAGSTAWCEATSLATQRSRHSHATGAFRAQVAWHWRKALGPRSPGHCLDRVRLDQMSGGLSRPPRALPPYAKDHIAAPTLGAEEGLPGRVRAARGGPSGLLVDEQEVRRAGATRPSARENNRAVVLDFPGGVRCSGGLTSKVCR